MAIQTFKQGLDSHPENVDLRFNLGTAYDKLGRFSDVVREMEAVLELNPNHTDTLNYLGYSYADRGMNIDEALSLTQRAVALKPDNGYYVDSLGWALFKMGRVEEALVEIKRAAELVKNDPVIFEHMGEIYLLQNDRDKAKQAWLRSIELNPKNGKLQDRFREEGFGDPLESMLDLQPKPQIIQYAE
jgi:Flp pilus assembly protein TadD